MKSEFSVINGACTLPEFTGIRVLHMPVILGDRKSVPEILSGYLPLLELCAEAESRHVAKVVYLTVDEKIIPAGESHRRPGLHVDGWYKTEENVGTHAPMRGGGWGGGGGGSWGGAGVLGDEGTGLLTIASSPGCKAWKQDFQGEPNHEGDCEHMRPQCSEDHGEILKPGSLYWFSSLCVHESLRLSVERRRHFVRLSLPSMADWYEGCTPNPLGVKPSGRVMPRRRFVRTYT
jgi:hypothetical protein